MATYDAPGIGDEPLPGGLELDPEQSEAKARAAFRSWRQASARRGIEEVGRLGWERFVIVGDSYGIDPAVRIALARRDAVRGLALGHAALSHEYEGPRAPVNKDIRDALTALLRTDTDGFIAFGIAQMTRGAVSQEQAARWFERFPDRALVRGVWELLGEEPEPIGERLRELDLPLLLAEHAGCLVETREGYEDIVAAFPDAQTVSCPEACATSPAFDAALREFCERGAS